MPNWCDNSLCITAKSKKAVEDLKKFKELAFTKDKYPGEKKDEKDLCLDFEKFAPYPEEVYEDKKEQEEIENLRKKGKDGEANKLEILYKLKPHKEFNWYGWNCANWGTKWNARPYGKVEEKSNRLTYRFDTAWSPPLSIVLKMSVMFPKLIFKIKYYECGMGFRGLLECKAGKILRDIYKNNLND